MNILVCFKVVADLDMMPDSCWFVDEGNYVETDFVNTTWSCFDESALEMALRLAESSNFSISLSGLSVGGISCAAYFKRLYSLGYEECVHIVCEEKYIFDPAAIACAIAGYVQNTDKYDLIIMGCQSSDENNSKVPFYTAEILGWPCLSEITELAYCGGETLNITNSIPGGMARQKIRMPSVLTIGNVPGTYLRIPTLKDKIKNANRVIQKINIDDLAVSKYEEPSLKKLERLKDSRTGITIEGNSADEIVMALLNNSVGKLMAEQ